MVMIDLIQNAFKLQELIPSEMNLDGLFIKKTVDHKNTSRGHEILLIILTAFTKGKRSDLDTKPFEYIGSYLITVNRCDIRNLVFNQRLRLF